MAVNAFSTFLAYEDFALFHTKTSNGSCLKRSFFEHNSLALTASGSCCGCKFSFKTLLYGLPNVSLLFRVVTYM